MEMLIDLQASYLNDLINGCLVGGQTGKGVFAEALAEGIERHQVICVNLNEKRFIR